MCGNLHINTSPRFFNFKAKAPATEPLGLFAEENFFLAVVALLNHLAADPGRLDRIHKVYGGFLKWGYPYFDGWLISGKIRIWMMNWGTPMTQETSIYEDDHSLPIQKKLELIFESKML